MRPKRKKADARQVAILNETYHRTHFPSTEERLHLSTVLGMSPRSVQIWFQNKRQSMGHTRQPASLNRPTNSAWAGYGDNANRANTYSALPYASRSSASVSCRRFRNTGGSEQRGDQ
ncbi:hypothetical protein CPB85DRAFT_1340739 [Mucidula mucida]|nr:hypothetical protein CPB85DRAFT_1340739 [Mucidula mucida]